MASVGRGMAVAVGVWLCGVLGPFSTPAVAASTWYVATNGLDTALGTSWSEAFRTISNAVAQAVDTDEVVVSNGTYNITNEIVISKAITVRSLNGPGVTTVQRSGSTTSNRIFQITNAVGAVLSGFTIRNGLTKLDWISGAGVLMYGGMVSNCIIRDNIAERPSSGGNPTLGGGIYMAGGLVVDCAVSNNVLGYWCGNGGGIYMAGGTVLRSTISSNNCIGVNITSFPVLKGGGLYMTNGCQVLNSTIRANVGRDGGGVYMVGNAVLRNCLVADQLKGGGVYLAGAGTIDNCTIAGNYDYAPDGWNGLKMTAGTVSNTIVYANRTTISGTVATGVSKSGGTFDYGISEVALAGGDNLVGDPRFLDTAKGNYRLGKGSPAVDSGTNAAWMTGTTDRDGASRLVNSVVDRGCYEEDPANGALRVYWEGTAPVTGIDSLPVDFTAYLSGSNTSATCYWNFGDGTTASGLDLTNVNHAFSVGRYTVTLSATNTLNEGAGSTRTNLVLVRTSGDTFAATNGGNVRPYTNWATAARNIQDAVDLSAGRALASNGTYNGTSVVVVDHGLQLLGMGGPTGTVLRRSSNDNLSGVLNLQAGASNALVTGFTIRDGVTKLDYAGGAGILMVAGTISNCVVLNNSAERSVDVSQYSYGGGILMSGGLVVDSTITSNATPSFFSGSGAGIYMTGGTVLRCTITSNACTGTSGTTAWRGGGVCMATTGCQVLDSTIRANKARYGGGVYMVAGTLLRNCLVADQVLGGGVSMAGGGTIESCTIAGNNDWAPTASGWTGLKMTGGAVSNTIVYTNNASAVGVLKSGGTFDYGITETNLAGVSNLTSNPLFMDVLLRDYRLSSTSSPAFDSGSNMDWMSTAVDLDGNSRIVNGSVDRGCYELNPFGGPFTLVWEGVAPLVGVDDLTVTFNATPSGTQTNADYTWSFGDGSTTNGLNLSSVSHTYTPGLYTVQLAATNLNSEPAGSTRAGYVRVRTSGETFAATNGGNIRPYTNWVTAASNIQDAVDMTASRANVSNGTYDVTAPVTLDRSIQLIGVGGPAATVIRRSAGSVRVMAMQAGTSNAWVTGFTLRNGYTATDWIGGAGLLMYGGTISNCIVRDNVAERSADGAVPAFGGGIYMTGGLVVDSTIVSNATPNFWSGSGGGIYMAGGTVLRCTIISNTCIGLYETGGFDTRNGGGIYMTNGCQVIDSTIRFNTGREGGGVYMFAGSLLRNCLVADQVQGGGVQMTGGAVESCTIAGNNDWPLDGWSGLKITGGSVSNTIVYANNAGAASVSKSGGSFDYGISETTLAGVDNLTDSPQFLDPVARDYRLGSPSSAAVNSGTNMPWMTGATDLDGNGRIVNDIVDRGCHEFNAAGGPFIVAWEGVAPLVGVDALTVTFNATPSGSETNATYYWSFGDGATTSGLNLTSVSHAYSAGLYTVQLAATNVLSEPAGGTQPNYVRVRASGDTFVATNGGNLRPYTNWATAALSVQDAIDMTASRTYVSNGTYAAAAPVTLDRGIELVGLGGPEGTILRRSITDYLSGVLTLQAGASNAWVKGFTIRDGVTKLDYGGGAGILMAGGTVSNCVVRNNSAERGDPGYYTYGGGIRMSGGLVVDSTIVSNAAPSFFSGNGAGIYMSGGTVLRCLVMSNACTGSSDGGYSWGGGGVYMTNNCQVLNSIIRDNNARRGGGVWMGSGTLLRNCLVADQTLGGGVYVTGGSVENCTIVGNNGYSGFSGLYQSGGGVTNTIIWGNTNTFTAVQKTGGLFAYSVSENAVAGTDNLTSDPLFVNAAARNFHLRGDSPCIGSGINLSWMSTAVDLDGKPRLVWTVDRGIFEAPPPGSAYSFR
jgi:hypothetical protein